MSEIKKALRGMEIVIIFGLGLCLWKYSNCPIEYKSFYLYNIIVLLVVIIFTELIMLDRDEESEPYQITLSGTLMISLVLIGSLIFKHTLALPLMVGLICTILIFLVTLDRYLSRLYDFSFLFAFFEKLAGLMTELSHLAKKLIDKYRQKKNNF